MASRRAGLIGIRISIHCSWKFAWPARYFPLNRPSIHRPNCTTPGSVYCEVGARTILHEVTLDDYSYVVNDAQITYTSIGSSARSRR